MNLSDSWFVAVRALAIALGIFLHHVIILERIISLADFMAASSGPTLCCFGSSHETTTPTEAGTATLDYNAVYSAVFICKFDSHTKVVG